MGSTRSEWLFSSPSRTLLRRPPSLRLISCSTTATTTLFLAIDSLAGCSRQASQPAPSFRTRPWRSKKKGTGQEKRTQKRFLFHLAGRSAGVRADSGCPSKKRTTTLQSHLCPRLSLILLLNLVREIHLKGRAEWQGGRRPSLHHPISLPCSSLPPCPSVHSHSGCALAWWQSRVQRGGRLRSLWGFLGAARRGCHGRGRQGDGQL